jgi:hypothetical protein
VATVTPGLAGPIAARARDLGLAGLYTGIRLTEGAPAALAERWAVPIIAPIPAAMRALLRALGA